MTNAALAHTESLASLSEESQPRSFVLVPGIRPSKIVPAFAAALLLLGVCVATILGINISVSRQQYDLVSLRAQQAELTGQNQKLKEQIDNEQAPQVLSSKAQKLGLVHSSKFAVLDVNKGVISGDTTPVASGAPGTETIPAPLPLKTRAAVGPVVSLEKVQETQSSASGRDLNGGSIPAPRQKPAPSAKTPTSAEKN